MDMSRANSIYRYDRSIEREIGHLKSDVNGEAILNYHYQRLAEGRSLGRLYKCMSTLKLLSKMLGKKFEEADKQDMVRLVGKIEQSGFSEWTRKDYKVVLKKFYQWLYGLEDGTHPPVVSWIKTGSLIKNGLKKSDLLTIDEIRRLVESATSLRDKALIMVLAESGRRIGEILTVRIGDVEFDGMGARLLVDGKTGKDHVRLISSAPMLATWLDNHPRRDEPSWPVWVTEKHGNKQLSYNSARDTLADLLRRAGIKKKVWFHLFRHTRGTQAAKILTMPQLCAMMGWEQGSDMAKVYVHLAGEDIDEAQALMNGISVQKPAEPKLEPRVCARCNHINSATSKFCNKCGYVLDLKTAVEMDSARDKMHMLLERLAQNPDALEMLLKTL